MIDPSQLSGLTPSRRAELIYSQARNELADHLWRATLGGGERRDAPATPFGTRSLAGDSLLALLGQSGEAKPGCGGACGCACCQGNATALIPAVATDDPRTIDAAKPLADAVAALGPFAPTREAAPATVAATDFDAAALGPNARYGPIFVAAGRRAGVPPAALAAIVDAEAARGADGSWKLQSRNPRSSAAGLGQFLNGTWQGLAEMRGTWLNKVAASHGWLDGAGKLRDQARPALLALRDDPRASIESIGDLARYNLDHLERRGVDTGDSTESVARTIYLAHALGAGDARRFINGTLPADRAQRLLAVQVGGSAAQQRIASAGDAVAAHRDWLLGYVDRHFRPDRFQA